MKCLIIDNQDVVDPNPFPVRRRVYFLRAYTNQTTTINELRAPMALKIEGLAEASKEEIIEAVLELFSHLSHGEHRDFFYFLVRDEFTKLDVSVNRLIDEGVPLRDMFDKLDMHSPLARNLLKVTESHIRIRRRLDAEKRKANQESASPQGDYPHKTTEQA